MKKLILAIFVLILAGATGFLLFHRNSELNEENTVIMKDSTGAEVRVPKQPKRVVFLNTSNMEVFVNVGGKPVGRTASNNITKEVEEKVKGVTEIGQIYAPNLEKLLSLKPDLVIGTNVPFNTALVRPLQVANVPVYINVIQSYEDVLRTIDLMGKFANREKEAAAKRAEIEKSYESLIKKAKTTNSKNALILFGNTESFSMATSKSFVGDLVRRLGGTNILDAAVEVKDSSYMPLSMEYVTKADPEIIMIISMSKGDIKETAQKTREYLLNSPQWKDIKAVKNKKVYMLEGALFTVNPGTHIIQAMEVLEKYLQGED